MTLQVLSLGAGVQSTTVLLKAVRGELPKPDVAIFSDTGWEPDAVYKHLDWLEEEARRAGIPIHRVSKSNIREDALQAQVRGRKTEGTRWASLPYFTLGPKGEKGMIRRQCTNEYKIRPIEREIRRILGIGYRQRWPNDKSAVRHWFGISADELRRVRIATEGWKTNWYPLIYDEDNNLLDAPMSRADCLAWCEEQGYPTPPRSACIGCPFHHDDEWRGLTPDEFEDACEFDDAIRNCGGMRGQVFLHAKRRPLREIDFRSESERGQASLFDSECLGYCGS